jgi:cytochrome c oxidase accessory protein FixG
VTGSPAEHPVGFGVVVVVTGLMFFDFAYFREQTCTFACPYGRMQSVMLDQQSLIVAYDPKRGEPRGKAGKSLPIIGQPARGDCVDCGACVQVCPTNIDIRKGLQMECIGCAQCVDACDGVMTKLERPIGLIRYTSHAELAGAPRKIWRARTMIYPAMFAAALAGLLVTLGSRTAADAWIERTSNPYELLADGRVSSPVDLRLENRTDEPRLYTLTYQDAAGIEVMGIQPRYKLAPRKARMIAFVVLSPRNAFSDGQRPATLHVADDTGWSVTLPVLVLGPEHDDRPAPAHDTHEGAHR